MTALELDTDLAGRYATAAISWADGLNRLRHDHERDLAALALTGTGPRAGELMARAIDELWTVAEFVRILRGRVIAADDLEAAELDVGALIAMAGRRVDIAQAMRDRRDEDWAYRVWLSEGDRSDVRADLEARHGSDPILLLRRLAPHEAIAYWTTLDRSERADVLERHPEVVALRLLANDAGVLDADELDAIIRSNAYPTLTTTLAATFDLDAGIRVIGISIGAGISAIVSQTNGSAVEMTLLADGHLGAEFGPQFPSLGGATITAGVAGQVEERFVFADATAAATAIERLHQAALDDASLASVLVNTGALAWNTMRTVQRTTGVPYGPLPLPSFRRTSATERQLDELKASNGTGTTERVGVFAEATAGFEADLHVIEAALDLDAETELLVYRTDPGPLATESGRDGVLWSGRIGGAADGYVADVLGPIGDELFPDGGGHADADLGFIVDIAQPDEGGTIAEFTLSGNAAAGHTVDFLDLEFADVTHADAVNDNATVVITLPVTPATAVDVATLASALTRGRVPTQPLRRMADTAEVEITTSRADLAEVEGAVELGAVEANTALATSTSVTTLALHRRPGGSLYARRDVDAAVERARRAADG